MAQISVVSPLRIRRSGQVHKDASKLRNKQKRIPSEDTTTADVDNLMDRLTEDLLEKILHLLSSPEDRRNAAAVSRKWLKVLVYMDIPYQRCNGVSEFLLTGKEVSDMKLAKLALRAYNYGSLTDLCIKGDSAPQLVSDYGLGIIAKASQRMKYLTLSGCILIGNAGLESIARWCTRLCSLNISNSPLLGDQGLISVAGNCLSLSHLHLDSCPFIGNESIVAFANGCKKLNVVVISECPRIGDTGVISLVSTRPKLGMLGLTGLRISDSVLEAIASLANDDFTLHLERIVGPSAAGYNVIAKLGQKLSSLTIISCVGFSVNSFMVPVQNKFSQLEELVIGDCDSITDDVLIELLKSSLLLRILRLIRCSGFTSIGLMDALTGCMELTNLELHKCCIGIVLEYELDELEMGELPEYYVEKLGPVQSYIMYPTLSTLHLKECTGVTDLLLSHISHVCTFIENIDLESADQITDAGLLSLLPPGQKRYIWQLNLKGCVGISELTIWYVMNEFGRGLSHLHLSDATDDTVAVVAMSCEDIVHLSLTGSTLITDFALNMFDMRHHMLELLDIRGCTGISRGAVEEFKRMLQSCKVMWE